MSTQGAVAIFSLVSASLLTSACSARLATPGEHGSSTTTVAVLQVENDQLDDMRVYAVRGQSRIRIGMVSAHQRQTFRIPQHLIAGDGTVELLAVALASRKRVSVGPLAVFPGQRITWWIAPSLAHSSAFVR